MDLEELRSLSVAFVENIYEANDEEDFDIPPMCITARGGKIELHGLKGESPMDEASTLLATLPGIEAMCFISAIWIRDPDTNERTGEGVLLMTETKTKRIGTRFEVKRSPLPVIKRMGDMDDGEIIARRPLLFELQ